MSETPVEAKNLIEEFLAQQRAEEQRRAEERKNQTSKDNLSNKLRKSLNARQVQRYARDNGLSVESGRGRHGVHIVATNGQECPLPVHGGGRSLARGTQGSIISFIQQNGMNRG